MMHPFITSTARAHMLLRRHAPTNILLDRLHSRRGLKWAIPTAVVLVPTYLFAASLCSTLIDHGGPGCLNLLVLMFLWNALKFGAMAPVSLLLWTRARICERRSRKVTRGVTVGYSPGRNMAPWTTHP